MENKLQQLTQKLYDEGLEKGRAEADKLVADAKAEARKIVAEARAEAEEIVKKAIAIQILWNGDPAFWSYRPASRPSAESSRRSPR